MLTSNLGRNLIDGKTMAFCALDSLFNNVIFTDSTSSLFRAILELREIVLAAYRGRNEVLRASLSPQAHDALSRGLEGGELLSPKKPSDPSKNLIS